MQELCAMQNVTPKRSVVVSLVLLAVVAVAGCKKGAGEDCVRNKDCGANMVCIAAPGTAKCLEIDKAPEACAAGPTCKIAGLCGVNPMTPDAFAICAATSEAHCANSSNCKTAGNCKLNAAQFTCTK
jgi:hypothetical protein